MPEGRLQRNIDRYCKKYCKLGLVVENKQEKDSRGQVSVKGMVGKQSKQAQTPGIKFTVKNMHSMDPPKLTFKSKEHSKKSPSQGS